MQISFHFLVPFMVSVFVVHFYVVAIHFPFIVSCDGVSFRPDVGHGAFLFHLDWLEACLFL